MASLEKETIQCTVEDIDEILAFLSPLDCKANREASSSVTLRRWPDLVSHCEVQSDDSASVVILKQSLREQLAVMEICDLVEKCKKLVTHLKTSGLDNSVGKHLTQEFEVRWNTHVDMLQSVDNNWTRVSYEKFFFSYLFNVETFH